MMNNDILSGEKLYWDVIAYSRLGEHRTGTEGDALTTQWIFNQLKDAGLNAFFQPYTFRQYLPTRINLTVGRQSIEAFPEWTPRFAGPQTLVAPLVAYEKDTTDVENKIVLLKYPSGRTERANFRRNLPSILKQIAQKGALAVVLITPGPSREVFISNDDSNEPLALPVLAVGSKDEQQLNSAAEHGEKINFLLDGAQIDNAESRNVLAQWGETKDVIIVSTPSSGWFTCGGERGPGIAIALALARWVGQHKPKTAYMFDFNSGHELMGLGAYRFLAERAPAPADVRNWLHLGANIATFDWERNATDYQPKMNPGKYVVQCGNEKLLPLITQAFSNIPEVKPFVGSGVGELIAFIQKGYPAWGIMGGRHYFFHNPSDGPQTTSPELLEAVAGALVKTLDIIETLPAKQ